MKLPSASPSKRGSVLIIVLWIAFGLVALTLYFGQNSIFAYRSSDFRVAQIEAEQAIEGAARYAAYILTNTTEIGKLPDPTEYEREFVPVGDAAFWFIGRLANEEILVDPFFALVDEAAKLNLNTATREMLEALPLMTPQLAAAIVDWRDSDEDVTTDGAESETYLRRNPPFDCKNARFESIEELRLLSGADPEILQGEDANRNGMLDPNEDDADASFPYDNRDGRLDPGIFEFVTVYSRESNTRTNGSQRINITNSEELTTLLTEKLGEERGRAIQQRISAAGGNLRSLLEFYIRSGMTPEEFASVDGDLTVSNEPLIEGLVNINTAPEQVLACLPGIGIEKASEVVAYRQSNTDTLDSIAWVAKALDEAGAIQVGPYITSRSYQVTADVAAVGHHGRGYRRTALVFDLTEGAPKIIYRRDLSRLGWALGDNVRFDLELVKNLNR